MIVTKSLPFTKKEIHSTAEIYEVAIKTVIDIEKRICSAGAEMHSDSEEILLASGSSQHALWGGGINLETKQITYNSFINIRPLENNPGNEIMDMTVRRKFEEIMKYFFNVLYEN